MRHCLFFVVLLLSNTSRFVCVFKYSSCSWHWAKAKETWGWEREVCVGWKGGSKGGVGRKWGLFVLCYLADISSMCRLAFWQAETTGALGMLSVQEISFILINATPNPSPAALLKSLHIFFLFRSLVFLSCAVIHLFVFCFSCRIYTTREGFIRVLLHPWAL